METISLRLSTEELALTFSQLGRPNIGKGLIERQLGPGLSQEEIHARLMSAGHSLLARDWMKLSDDGRVVVGPVLQRIATALTCADFSIRYSRADDEGERFLSYHFSSGAIFKHVVEHDVVHRLAECQNADAVITGGLEFLQVQQSQSFAVEPLELPLALLETIDADLEGKTDPEEARALATQHLYRAGVPDTLRPLLAEDLAGELYRGSILHIEYDHGSTLRADHGLLVVRGPQRLWLWRLITRDGTPQAVVLAGSEQTFHQEVAALFQ